MNLREKRDRSRDRDVKEKKKKDKDRSRSRSRSRSRERSCKDKKKHKKDKERREGLEDGEMSEKDGEAGEIRSSEERGRSEDREKRKEEKTRNGDDHEDEKMEEDDDQKKDEDDNQKKEKEERMLASLRKREEEEKMEMEGHLRDRDKDRVQHLHQEAVNGFSAALTGLIRAPDFSWKEAKKHLKKDSRWEVASNLDKSERERLFDEHIDKLIAKKKENFRSLLDECKDIGLDTSFKEVKKQIRDDPRYAKFSSSDRKCEKEFKEWLKDRVSGARSNYRQLLQETKIISHKSLQMIKVKEGNHMEDIQEMLSKDSRYLFMERINGDCSNILMAYLEELERRGPPPPPTESEPSETTK